jgi:hypothetical protein
MLGSQPDGPIEEVSLHAALAPLLCAALLYTVSWALGCSRGSSGSHNPAGGRQLAASESLRIAPQHSDEKLVPAISGRKLTIERTAHRTAISLQFSNPEFGIAFDAPKGYVLKEGDLPQMDRGLGYLGPIPMHFVQPGGVRLATVEAPEGVHLGTNFVNEFFTVSAHYESTAESCAAVDIASESRGAVITRDVDRIAFHGFEEHFAASLHQYIGIYLHGYANETCYEIGYGVATVGDEGAGNLRRLDPDKRLRNLEGILASVRIAAPEFEHHTATE